MLVRIASHRRQPPASNADLALWTIQRSITTLRRAVQSDRRVLMHGDVKDWLRRRWQFLFVEAALADPQALQLATFDGDRRPARRRIAEHFLPGATTAWQDRQPYPWHGDLTQTTVVFCPGMLNGLLPVRAFADDLPRIGKRFAVPVVRADSNPLGSCAANTEAIVKAIAFGAGLDAAGKPIAETDQRRPQQVMLIGYSKGGPDILTALARHPELASTVRCVMFWASPLLGTPAADDAMARLTQSETVNQHWGLGASVLKRVAPRGMAKWIPGLSHLDDFDTRACTADLTTGERSRFFNAHRGELDRLALPMFSVSATVAREQVPVIQRPGFDSLFKHETTNDMQVISSQARLPLAMATDLATVRGHHWDVGYPAFQARRWRNNMRHAFPKTAALTASIQLAAELGLID